MVLTEEIEIKNEESSGSKEQKNAVEIDLSYLSSSASSASSSSSSSSSSVKEIYSTSNSIKESDNRKLESNNLQNVESNKSQMNLNVDSLDCLLDNDSKTQVSKINNAKIENLQIYLNQDTIKGNIRAFKEESEAKADFECSDSKLDLNTQVQEEKIGANEAFNTTKSVNTPKPINPYKKKKCSISTENNNNNRTSNKKVDECNIRNDICSISEKTNLSARQTKIKCSFYKPLPFIARNEPNLHQLSLKNRPQEFRTETPTNQIFQQPVLNFWKTKFRNFNHMQSEMASKLSFSDDNIVVSAPTGAGKTACFEMAMARIFTKSFTYKMGRFVLPNHHKIVYIAPSKALCEERFDDWSKRLFDIHAEIKCVKITGDSSPDTFSSVATAHVILTTPEKWDSVTRKWTDHLFLIASVKLLLLDEVHLLGDQSRGSCLETVVCRMKTVQRAASSKEALAESISSFSDGAPECLGSKMRIVAVSATLPNISDIALFLDAPSAFAFDSSYRPVPLTIHVVGCGYIGKNQFLFDKSLNKQVPGLLTKYSRKKPSLVFCHTKKEAELLAVHIADSCNRMVYQNLSHIANKASVNLLHKCLRKGVAYHHAGLDVPDRKLVEQSFAGGLISCLCATSTLAMGVNLPAALVIIKGTVTWRGSGQGHQDIDPGTLLQMIGRAGRPGYDTGGGVAVIMTDNKSRSKYEKVTHGLEEVESQLLRNLVETLNTEISQKVITDTSQAINWLKSTFFFIRVRKNPRYYGMQGKSEQQMNAYLMERCMNTITELNNAGITSFLDDGFGVDPLEASHIMSKQMIAFESMKNIMSISFDSDPRHIILALSECEMLHRPVRRAEKKILNEAYKLIKYKLDESGARGKIVRIQSPQQKVYVLLQTAIGQEYIEDFTLRQEMSHMVDIATRILKALEEFSVQGSRHGYIALQSLKLRRSLATSLWGSKDGVLNQIRGVGAKTTEKLLKNDVITFADVSAKSSYEIEQLTGRKQPFGQELRASVAKILRNSLTMTAYIEENDHNKSSQKFVICKLERSYPESNSIYEHNICWYTLAVHSDQPQESSFMFREYLSHEGEHRISCPKVFGKMYVHLISNLIGLDVSLTLQNKDIEDPVSTEDLSPVRPPFNTSKSNKHGISSSKGSKNIGAKGNRSNVNSNKRAELTEQHSSLVESVQDFRIQPKSNAISDYFKEERLDKRSLTPTDQPDTSYGITQNFVTPSPSLPLQSQSKVINRKNSNSSSMSTQKAWDVSKSRIRNMGCNEKIIQDTDSSKKLVTLNQRSKTKKSTWQNQKHKQQALQKNGMSPKQNPFSAFKFDPNDAESQLDSLCNESSQLNQTPKEKNVCSTPLNLNTIKRSRFLTSGTIVRTPLTNPILSAKRMRMSKGRTNRITDQELLRLKASEQQSYFSRDLSYPTAADEHHNPYNNGLQSNPYSSCLEDLQHATQPPPPFLNRLVEEIYPSQLSQNMSYDGGQEMTSHFQRPNFAEFVSFDGNSQRVDNENGTGIHLNSEISTSRMNPWIDDYIPMKGSITKDDNYNQNFEVSNAFEDHQTFNTNPNMDLVSSQVQYRDNIMPQNHQLLSLFNAASSEGQLSSNIQNEGSIISQSHHPSSECDDVLFYTSEISSKIKNPYRNSNNKNVILRNDGNDFNESYANNFEVFAASGKISNPYRNSNNDHDFITENVLCENTILRNDGNELIESCANKKDNDIFEDAFL